MQQYYQSNINSANRLRTDRASLICENTEIERALCDDGHVDETQQSIRWEVLLSWPDRLSKSLPYGLILFERDRDARVV